MTLIATFEKGHAPFKLEVVWMSQALQQTRQTATLGRGETKTHFDLPASMKGRWHVTLTTPLKELLGGQLSFLVG